MRERIVPIEAITAFDSGAARNERLGFGWDGARTIAAGRFLLATSLAFFAISDPGSISFKLETDDIAATAYWLFSFLMLLVAWRSWWFDFLVFPVAYGIDVLAFIVIPATLLPDNDVDLVAMLTMATYVLLAAGKRWNWETAAVIAVVLNLVYIVAYIAPPQLGFDLSADDGLRRIGYLALVSFLLVRTRRREKSLTVPGFDFNDLSGDRSVLDSAVEYVEAVCGTGKSALCWTHAGENECALAQRGLEQHLASAGPPDCIVAEEYKDAPPFLFDTRRRRALMIRSNGEVGMYRRAMKDSALLKEFGIERGGCIRIDGVSGHGMLLVGDTRNFNADFLKLLVLVGNEVASGIDRFAYMAVVHEKALANLSQAIARDLHDGAAQALAGARFWLMAMKQQVADRPELLKEIDEIQNALSEEHLYIRDAITRLRRGTNSREHSELADELQNILTAASVQWRIDARFAGHKRRMNLPTMLVLEVRKIVREAIANCARHGKAQDVELRCNLHEGQLLLTVSDNGSGFADNADDHKPQTIMERVNNLGGSLHIRAEAGWTHLEVSLPIGEIK